MTKTQNKKSAKSGNSKIYLFVVLILIVLNIAGAVMIEAMVDDIRIGYFRGDSVEFSVNKELAMYPSIEAADSALATEKKFLRQNYDMDIKMATDSILTLVAKGQDLHTALNQSVSSFTAQDSLQCFWYRWSHTELLSSVRNGKKQFFPYTTLDSLACVILYPTVFNK